ncbi:MAG: spermidine/putrescine ABC transporter substrate-binding protein [Chlamydiales bacterium 38-26]|nr:spermidine/putrescine ABC transporter substrate-binding protein [Chlamydiales bacterium]OJV07654.1 MAG: spermidine/putrescine ABC transporter substrate-binding protein [Chlamydiales bacterium 38-26]
MKKFLFFMLAFLYLAILVTTCGKPENELHLYIWADYIKPELIERFEKEYQCHVVYDAFDTNESMYAKLKLGATGYDVIFPSGYTYELMLQQNMLDQIQVEALPNLKNLDPKYLPDVQEQGQFIYAVPFAISYSGVAYRKDKTQVNERSWSIFGRTDLKGRMTMLNDIREALGAALKYLGYSANTLNKSEINQAADQLIEWKKNLAKFESEQNKHGIASAEYIVVQGYNGDMLQVMRENANVDFFIPKEGSIISIDYAVIPKYAQNTKLAHAFINFLLNAGVAAENMQFTQFSSPNKAAFALLPESMQNNPALFPPQEILDKSDVIKYLGKEGDLYNQAWDRVKKS